VKSLRIAGIALAGLVSCAIATTAAATPANCAVPLDRLLRRLELDLPGATRVTRSVEIPADTEILIEAFETGVNSRLEVRTGAEVASAESALHRWPPHRLIVASGPARKVDVTVAGIDRAHGRVDVRISRLASRDDRRCVDFWREMASGDAAYSRGAMIFRAEIDAAPGASREAYESAVAAYARAARILGPGGFDEAQARLVIASALMNALERYKDSLEAASVAEAHFKALGHEYGRDLARYYRAYSLAYDAMRTTDAAEAKQMFETSRTTFIEVAADHLRRGELRDHAQAVDGTACANGFLFRYAEAIAGYQRALEIFDELREPDLAVAMRQNLAFFESQFGRYQEALKRHLEILAEGDSIKDRAAFMGNLRNAAFLELKLGKYDDALRHYSDAYARSLRMQSPVEQAKALYGLGSAYHAIGNFGEALSYLERSLELHPEQQAARDRAITLRTVANVLSDTGRGREAITRREEAWRTTHIPPQKARITLELIDDRIEVGDLAIAKSLIAPLLAARDIPEPAVQIGATLASARIALAEGDARSAARDARTAAEYYRSHELTSLEFEALLVQARAACAAGSRDEAHDIAETALQRAEEIRTFSSNPTLRASLWRQLRPAFGFTIGLLARANSCGSSAPADALGALAIAEGSRGRALEDFRLRSSTDTVRSKTNEQRRVLFEQLAGVRQQLETLSQTASADDERLKVLRTEAARLRREIDLTGGLPGSNQHRAEDPAPALRARIDAIPKDTAVVEYWMGKDDAFAWLLTRGRVQLVDLGPAGRIDAAARRMHEAMRNWLTGTIDQRIAPARELHELIIAPLPSDLERARTVYFIPDGALHAVPFAALARNEGKHLRYFVDSHDVAVAPAFLAIAPDSERRAVRNNSVALVVVDPVYTRDDARLARGADPVPAPQPVATTLRGTHSWTRLPATAREAATISKLLDRDAVQVLSGFDASRDSLLGRDLKRYDILHFATHAVADTEAPQLSALVLSTFDAQGKPRVGEVFAGDLADQRLGASLVVFSGCETALGRAEAGEGLLGLRYAAHASGARAVIASLWPVMDAAGASLMDDLYADVIGRHESPVAALSRAMRGARARWEDPALWAAFDVSIAGF
jgi:CHAT domain-containing protein/phosphoglycolate phosphatase-like HAD superfamily hydrolase